MANFFYNLGKVVGQQARKANWFLQALTGDEAARQQAEHAVGRDLASGYLREMPFVQEPKVRQFVEEIAAALSTCVQKPGLRFTVCVVDKREYNAFALPGGFLFVLRPLLELLDWQRDEIAFVLAHEMGHVLARHSIERMLANSMITGGLARVPIGGLLGMGVMQMATTLLSQGYSQDQELEADRLAVKLLHCAGLDALAGVRVLQRLGALPTEAWLASTYFASHPPVHIRVEHIQRAVRELRP